MPQGPLGALRNANACQAPRRSEGDFLTGLESDPADDARLERLDELFDGGLAVTGASDCQMPYMQASKQARRLCRPFVSARVQ